jgi:hypothetical protein
MNARLLTEQEKAYCRALEALATGDYAAADREFDVCSALFEKSSGFNIVAVATKLLVRLQQEKIKLSKIKNEIEETDRHGEETIVRGQGEQEETR